ncbi:AMP-binding protein [Actinomadura sp. LD22]|uniref:AMP-binding protein n=2 Tax=Actinomadura physcomitrii TaxID=2650748 RepID=A0A6I4MRE2_9ACTN|nr:AMP-binding protein [Actinomadura physcomitrii]
MTAFADRPAVAERATELVRDPASGRRSARLLPEFTTRTYGRLWDQARAVATAWAAQGVGSGDLVAVLGFISADYVTVNLATTYLGAVSVPLQANGTVAQLSGIIEETKPRLIATTPEYLNKAAELALAVEPRPAIVVLDYHPDIDDERETFEAAGRTLREAGSAIDHLAALEAQGSALPAAPLFVPEPGTDPLTLLIYTSGSTGAPKGAMYTESMVRRYWGGRVPQLASGDAPVTVSYMPMGHMFGQTIIWGTFRRGGVTHFTARSDLSALFEDFALARPTELHAVPRVFDMLYQLYQSELTRRRDEFGDPGRLDAAVQQYIRDSVLGGRVGQVIVGSAPTSAETRAFVESFLGRKIGEGYGTTETGNIMRSGKVQRPPVLEYKLVDVPELGYFGTDRPYPRGELLVKTENIFPGYYRRPELTASVFDEDGFYRTGDIMAQVGVDELVYVDRRNNVQKLSQGEFVAISKVEGVFSADPAIRQCYVYGNSARPYLLAVIVPSEMALREAGGTEALRTSLAEALQRTANQAGLESYEIPRDFLIEEEAFSAANGLLSDVGKLLRPRLRERYGERLERLYATLAQDEADELRRLRAGGPGQPVYETISRAARALLGCADSDLSPEARFTELGGDSMSALSFSTLLQDIFGVEVPVGVVISPANDLRAVADHVEGMRAGEGRQPTFASVHGAGATEVRSSDLRLDGFIDAATLDEAARLPAPDHAAPETVLLTGATGYLGRFMCLEWLERLAETGGRLVCVVRATDDGAARERLDDAFDTGDEDLLRHYRELAADHLDVLAGDLGEPRLGLSEADWARLADEVDAIMHPGALVNHVLPYDQLFGPNVVGTAELIKLAITGRIKPFTYVSTIAAGSQAAGGRFDEATDIRESSPVRRNHGAYANGYGTSKWAAEVLLREAHDAVGLPVAVFRSDMILAHSRYRGQINVPDVFTRLLFSLLVTGIAPTSFYRTDGEDRPRAHYDELPADFSAEAVNAIGGGRTAGYRTYHLINPHDDGISLDTYVDWLVEAGHDIQRLDHGVWLKRFEAAMRGLPEKQRQQSLLPLLKAYERPLEPVNEGIAPAQHFQAAVRETGVAGGRVVPHVTRELILKYVTDLRALGLL